MPSTPFGSTCWETTSPTEGQDGQHQKKAAVRTAECLAQPKDYVGVTGLGD